jgi:hypothetical protein
MDIIIKNILYILFMTGFISFFVFLYRIIRKNEKSYLSDTDTNKESEE